jgi:hypothetical protein
LSVQRFDPALPGEKPVLSFDFSLELAADETIASVVGSQWTATVESGTDADPDARISGSTTVSGAIVSQALDLTVAGVTYLLECEIVTSKPQTLKGRGLLRVAES